MAVGLVFNAPDFTEAQYQQVRNRVNPDNQLGDGLLYHAAGPSENGFCVIEVWESQEAIDRFFREKLGAALQETGINVQPTLFEVMNTMT